MQVLWVACLMVVMGTLLLRLAGRRSIAQMTFGSVMVMLALGTVLAEPIARKSAPITVLIAAVMVATLVVIEWLQLHFKPLQRIITGQAVVVIENGVVNEPVLRRLRMTREKLEMRLRQKGIKHLSDVKVATVEVNGDLGYELQPYAEPLTVGKFEEMMRNWMSDKFAR